MSSVEGVIYYGFPINRDDYTDDNYEFLDGFDWLEDPLDWYYRLGYDYKKPDEIGVDIGIAGSLYSGDNIYYVYVKGTKKVALWGEMINVSCISGNQWTTARWLQKISDFCLLTNLDVKLEDIGWYLTSLKG